MATWNYSWKAFYRLKKPELQSKYPFLKEYQIKEKVKKLWRLKKEESFEAYNGSSKDPLTPPTKKFKCKENVSPSPPTNDYRYKEETNDIKRTTSTAHLEKKTIDQMRTKPNNGLSKLDNTYREGGFITNNSCCYPSGTVSPLSGGIDAIELMMNKEEEEVDTCDRITVETTTCHWTKGGCTCGHDVTCLNKPITNSAFVHHDNDVVEGSSGWSQSPDTSLCNEDSVQIGRPLNSEPITDLFQPLMVSDNCELVSGSAGRVPRMTRRVFRSSRNESGSNFHSLFTEDSDIFL